MPNPGLKGLCRYAGDADFLASALIEAGFVARGDAQELIVCGWAEHNAQLVAAWDNGKKGGRPKKNPTETQRLPNGNPTQTGSKPIREDKRREDKRREDIPPKSPKGDGEGNGKPEPKLLLMQTMVEAWNAKATDHPDDLVAVAQLTDQRKTKLRTRLKDATWQVRFAEALARLPIEPIGDRAWRPTFDWLIQNDTNASKLAEGQYQSKQVKLSLQEIFERELGGTE